MAVGCLNGLVEIGDDVANVLDADRQADEFGRDAGCGLLLYGELLVGGGGRMNDEGLGVADVGNERKKFEGVDELLARFVTTLDAEGDERALAVGQVFLRARVVGAGVEAGVVDPIDAGMLLKMLGDGEGILGVALEAEVERLNPLQKQEGVEWREGGAGVAQPLHAGFEDEGQRTEGLGVGEAMVGRIGLGELLEAAGSGPVEFAGVDNDAADGGAVAAEKLGGGVDDDVCAPLDGANQRRRSGGVVDDEGQAVFMGDGGELLDVGDVELGIAEGLGVDGAGLRIDSGAEAVEVVGVNEADV